MREKDNKINIFTILPSLVSHIKCQSEGKEIYDPRNAIS